MVQAERQALEMLVRMCPPDIHLIMVSDRGFGNARWLSDIRNRGGHFVQRLSCIHHVSVEHYIGSLGEMGIRRGARVRDWGWGTMNEQQYGPDRLITVFERESEEVWYLVTDLEHEAPAELVRVYRRRMWTEAMLRHLKNRDWGLGLDHVRLSQSQRHDRHFAVIALAYVLLAAFGAIAERLKIDRQLTANTRKDRVMNLARIGNHFLPIYYCPLEDAFHALQQLPI